MKVVIATLLITRKCNLRCDYCRIVNNNYPNELNGKEWCKAIDILKKLGCQFNVLLGGEPTQHPDILSILKHCHKKDIPYALSTNAVFNKRFEQDLLDINLQNFSISYDGDGCEVTANIGSLVKSDYGLEKAKKMKENGVPDVHATITVTKKNLPYIRMIVEMLNSLNIWTEITALHWSKGNKYDMFPAKVEMQDLVLRERYMPLIRSVMADLKNMKAIGYKIHNDIEYFDAFIKYSLNLDWKCKGTAALCIEADGRMRTCLHYNGDECKKFTIFDLEDPIKFKEFEKAMEIDISNCYGCFWDCSYQAEQHKNDVNKAKEVFQHGKK